MSFNPCRPNSEQRLPGVAVILSSAFEPISTMDGPSCRSDCNLPRYFPTNLPTRPGPPRKSCIDLPPEQTPPNEPLFSHRTEPVASTGAQDLKPITLRHQRCELHRQSSACYQPQSSRYLNIPGPKFDELHNSPEPREDERSEHDAQWYVPQERQHVNENGLGLQQIEPFRPNENRVKITLENHTDRSRICSTFSRGGSLPHSAGGSTLFQDAPLNPIPVVDPSPWAHPQQPKQGSRYVHDPYSDPRVYQPGPRRYVNCSINQTGRTAISHLDTYPSPRHQLPAFLPSISPPYSALRSALPTISHPPLTPRESASDLLPEGKVKETYPSPPSTDHPFKWISSFAPLPLSLEDLVDPSPVKSDIVDDDVQITGQILLGLAKGRTPVLGLGVGFDGPPANMSNITVVDSETRNEAKMAGEIDGSESNDEIIPTTRTPSPVPVSRTAEATLTQSRRMKKRTSLLSGVSASLAVGSSRRRSLTRGLPSTSGPASTTVSKMISPTLLSLDSVAATSSGSVGTSEGLTKSATPKNSKRRTKKSKTKVSMEKYDPEHSRPFGCDMCVERFLRKNDYVRHQRIHSGDKPYVCPICSMGFMRNDALLRHIDHTSACAARAPSREEFVFGMSGLKRRKSFSVSTAPESSHVRNHKKRKA